MVWPMGWTEQIISLGRSGLLARRRISANHDASAVTTFDGIHFGLWIWPC